YVKDKIKGTRVSKVIKLGFLFIESEYFKLCCKQMSSKLNLEAGQDFCENKLIKFSNFEKVKLIDNIFSMDPFLSNTWRWKIQQLAFVPYVIGYFESKKNQNN